MPAYTGKFLDGFGNHITVWAVSNPVVSDHEPADLYDRAPGFGIARFNKEEQSITMECWPRWVEPSEGDEAQYLGWPLTISVDQNYGREPVAYLPELNFQGIENPVVQVIENRSQNIVYSRRVTNNRFRPPVFSRGAYDIRVGEPGTDRMQTLENIASESETDQSTLIVTFTR
jgi:hypothetical protein